MLNSLNNRGVGDLAEGVQDVVFGVGGGVEAAEGGRYRGEGACTALNMAFEHNFKKSIEIIRID